MSVRTLLYLNAVFLAIVAGYVAWRLLSPRNAQDRAPANQEQFLPDEDLESRRLERVLGWALLFGAVVAVTLPLYWLREPVRQEHSVTYFDEGAVHRGQTLFAAPGGEGYNSVLSLQCATCHGADGSGGAAQRVIDPDGEAGPLPPTRYTWTAPALNTVLLRFQEDPECADDRQRGSHVCEVSEIITYGRPGTPMPAFGVAGGGAENTQTINDVVAYLRTIQLSPEEARQQATDALAAAKQSAGENVGKAETALEDAETALDEALAAAQETLGMPSATDTEIQAECEEIEARLEEAAGTGQDLSREITTDERRACADYVDAVAALDAAEAALEWTQQWQEAREDVSDGQLLFELYCARCHTEGWSVFNPADPETAALLGEPGGGGGSGGGIGFNLRGGSTVRRFGPGEEGVASHTAFISEGSTRNREYGIGGVGSGKMPGFANMLTEEQIAAIVQYEREEIDDTTYPRPGASGATASSAGNDTTTEG